MKGDEKNNIKIVENDEKKTFNVDIFFQIKRYERVFQKQINYSI